MRGFALNVLLWLVLVAAAVPARAAGVDEVFEKPQGQRSWGEILGWLTGFPFASEQKPFGRSYALVVGINDYKGEAAGGFKPLATTGNDPFRMKDFLLQEEGFDRVHVLTNEKVTWDRLRKLMVDELPRLLKPEDRFLFYWNGHGTQDAEYAEIGYLPLAGSDRESYGSMVSMNDVLEWDRRLRARHVLFLVDACFSGLARPETQSGLGNATIAQLAKPTHQLMTAGTKDERTIADQRWGGSLFTYALIEAARGRADAQTSFPSDGVVHLSEMLGFVRQLVDQERAAARWDGNITPRTDALRGSNEGEFFFLTNEAKAKKLAGQGERVGDFKNGMPESLGGAGPEAPALDPVEQEGTVTAATRARREPRAGSAEAGSLPRDSVVYVVGATIGRDKGWYLVERDGRPLGYVLARNVALGGGEARTLDPAPASVAEASGSPLVTGPVELLVRDPDPPYEPGDVFRDCAECPEMVVVPAGNFMMGSPPGEEGRDADEGPQRRVTIARPFAVGRFEVTFAEWNACVTGGGCGGHKPSDGGWGRGRRPVIDVSWDDAKAYVAWLGRETGQPYRLLSEAEWEYVARAGTTTPFWPGTTISTDQANYDGNSVYGSGRKGEYRERTVEVGTLPANPWGLHEVHGNVWEWVEDCYKETYEGVPADGRAWTSSSCPGRVLRSGSWGVVPWPLRAANRDRFPPKVRNSVIGFRVARTFTP